MNSILAKIAFAALAVALFDGMTTGTSAAGQLVYQPTDPGFGGSPLYKDYYISMAQLQKKASNDGAGSGGGGGVPSFNFPDISLNLGGLGGAAAAPTVIIPIPGIGGSDSGSSTGGGSGSGG